MITDIERIKTSFDLLAQAERDTELRRVATTGGGEYAGACPFCVDADHDGFRVQPYHSPYPRWMCRKCSDGWQDAIEYIKRRYNCDFPRAVEILGGNPSQGNPSGAERRTSSGAEFTRKNAGASINSTVGNHKPRPAYTPPAAGWQAEARRAVEVCRENLWNPGGRAALDYMRGRGLRDDTLRYFAVGYSPGATYGSLYIPRGVVIPCLEGSEVWYIKIRSLDAEKPKYQGVKGNRTNAIYNAGDLIGAEFTLFCEGEIDVMTAWQELPFQAVVTTGAALNLPDLATWGMYLGGLKHVFIAFDADSAGEKGRAALLGLFPGGILLSLPAGVKDINELYMAGGNLWEWVKPVVMPVVYPGWKGA